MAKVGRPKTMKDRTAKMIYLDADTTLHYQKLANRTGRSFSEVCRDTLKGAMKK